MNVDSLDPVAVTEYACGKFNDAVAAEDEQVYWRKLAEGRAAREILCDVRGHTEEQLDKLDAAYEEARSHGREKGWEDQEIPCK